MGLDKSGKIRILFTNWADSDNYNAQSLNARAIASRLNPDLFDSTLFYRGQADPDLLDIPSVRLIRILPRCGTIQMLVESMRHYDIIFKANPNRFTYLYVRIPEKLRRRTALVEWIEGYIPPHLLDLQGSRRRYSRFIKSRLRYVYAITEYVEKKIFEEDGIRVAGVIPVGVDTKLFAPPQERKNKVPIVLFIGHLIERKGPQFVVEAARHFPGVQFILLGERRGNFYRCLYGMVENWALDNVTFLPPTSQKNIAWLMQKSDILLHPSIAEGMPKVVLEAAATGLPAVVFDSYEAPNIIDGVTGFRVKDFGEMLIRLRTLLEDKPLRLKMGSAAREHALKYNWDSVVKSWENEFREIAEGRYH